jgi:putative FmdB family regulatory protein
VAATPIVQPVARLTRCRREVALIALERSLSSLCFLYLQAANYDSPVPIYEFECEACGERFEELVAAGVTVACRGCGSERTRRLYSSVAPPGRQPRGAKVRADESRRREREAARQDRMAESRKRRSLGEKP